MPVDAERRPQRHAMKPSQPPVPRYENARHGQARHTSARGTRIRHLVACTRSKSRGVRISVILAAGCHHQNVARGSEVQALILSLPTAPHRHVEPEMLEAGGGEQIPTRIPLSRLYVAVNHTKAAYVALAGVCGDATNNRPRRVYI